MATPHPDGNNLIDLGASIAVILGAVATVATFLWRRAVRRLGAWRKGDQALEQRLSAIATKHDKALGEFKTTIERRLSDHETHDEQRFAKQDRRLEAITDQMARRDDQMRIEGKIDELLLQRSTRRRTRARRAHAAD